VNHGPQILILEDEAPLLSVLEEFLASEGMRPVGAGQPNVALDVAADLRPQLIIIDVMLSGASGIEVAVKLRERGFRDTPIIAISASPLMLDFARQMGIFDGYLTKPFDLDDLLARVQSLLQGNESEGSG
jgi:two-component system phosphate regulon response regulator PhoB